MPALRTPSENSEHSARILGLHGVEQLVQCWERLHDLRAQKQISDSALAPAASAPQRNSLEEREGEGEGRGRDGAAPALAGGRAGLGWTGRLRRLRTLLKSCLSSVKTSRDFSVEARTEACGAIDLATILFATKEAATRPADHVVVSEPRAHGGAGFLMVVGASGDVSVAGD